MPRPKLVVLGRMCHDAVGGAVWHFLNYLLGFEKLGFETYYVEWTDNWVAHPEDASRDSTFPRVLIKDVMARYGFGDRWICRADHLGPGATFGGFGPDRLPSLYAEAQAIVNVSGTHVLNEQQRACPRRVYLETDPGIPQIRLSNGDTKLTELLGAHTHVFTFAENLYGDDCPLPRTAAFRTTRQAVALEQWNGTYSAPSHDALTTIAKWEKKAKTITFQGEVYRWSKRDEFVRFLQLPRRAPMPLELALSSAGEEDIALLKAHGWCVADALAVSSSLSGYRDYIRGSSGEFTIAKDQYVRLRTGWFSDRSACYLAAGRPVITQDTGFGRYVPTGRGLFAFNTEDEALASIDAVWTNPAAHGRAAREIAHEYFDSDKVLGRLLSEIGVEAPGP